MPGFKYLEGRLTGACAAPYDCAAELKLFRLVQIFDPLFAAENGTISCVRELAAINPLAVDEKLLDSMCIEMPTYRAEATRARIDCSDVSSFTDEVLQFWRNRATVLPSWARAARIVFAISCNSAACERVFSLLECMFGRDQLTALSDVIGGSLMLMYNKRTLG